MKLIKRITTLLLVCLLVLAMVPAKTLALDEFTCKYGCSGCGDEWAYEETTKKTEKYHHNGDNNPPCVIVYSTTYHYLDCLFVTGSHRHLVKITYSQTTCPHQATP